LGEQDDGVYDWNRLNDGKGWEANASHSRHTPHRDREHRRDRERERERERERGHRTARPTQDTPTGSPLVASPAPAVVKSSRRHHNGERTSTARDIGSVQPLAPTSRRTSQARDLSGGNLAPHPYATAPSPKRYHHSHGGNPYGRHSSHSPQAPNGNPHQSGSETYLYVQGQGKTGTVSRENTTTVGTTPFTIGPRAMVIYDHDRIPRDGGGGHGRMRGLWAALCC